MAAAPHRSPSTPPFLDADPEEIDPLARDEPLLAALYSASVRGRIATGPRAGQAVLRFGDRIDVEQLPASGGQRCANIGGVSLHANVAVPARDRLRLERLCRYAARPPLATGTARPERLLGAVTSSCMIPLLGRVEGWRGTP